jgi:hypothetical protein
MDFSFDNFNNFYVQHASLSCRTLAPTNYPQNIYPHEPCSYCSIIIIKLAIVEICKLRLMTYTTN